MYVPVAGKSLTIIVPEGSEKGTYTSTLYSINSNELILSKPLLAGSNSPTTLPVGLQVIVDYQDAKDIPCCFETIVVDLIDKDHDWMLLKCPDKIERHQRRENYRKSLSRPVTLRYHAKEIPCVMNDLSGGGCSVWLSTFHRLKPNDIVELSFSLQTSEGSSTIETEAEIVNVQHSNEENNKSLCSLKFISLREESRQQIVKFIYHRHAMEIALTSVGRNIMY